MPRIPSVPKRRAIYGDPEGMAADNSAAAEGSADADDCCGAISDAGGTLVPGGDVLGVTGVGDGLGGGVAASLTNTVTRAGLTAMTCRSPTGTTTTSTS